MRLGDQVYVGANCTISHTLWKRGMSFLLHVHQAAVAGVLRELQVKVSFLLLSYLLSVASGIFYGSLASCKVVLLLFFWLLYLSP